MELNAADEQTAVVPALCAGLLGSVNESLGAPMAPAWEAAFRGVPRHAFLPGTVWVGDELAECSRESAPAEWLGHAYADTAVVTQVNDGDTPAPGERWASCSASAPSIVFRMLDLLDVRAGHRVLEIGTGTGWNAALLAHRLGPGRVTTIEVDPALAADAGGRLEDMGLDVRAVHGDGALGHETGEPYDRIIATCSVRTVPPAWIAQTRPGGVVLVPWDSPWFCYGLLRLTVDGYGGASGFFSPHSAFMLLRGQRTDLRIYRDVVRDSHVPEESTTRLSPWAVAGEDWAAQFAIGLQLPHVWRAWHENPDVEGVDSRLWLADTDATSWAAVDLDGRTADRFTVWEHGPRRLWEAVEAAYGWWREAGSPGPERFGMTVAPDGTHVPWLDVPDSPVPVLV
ncbi:MULTISPECIES: methyltransferase domain-containing protein [unclassified Streptomyces]|uniref:methyltransferase domain-containing protein n=1 Tax=unclassified Streptomyces TaxID=2593676 RepID=UPI000B50CA2F|nr:MULTISPECIES: methyltransferase domain-containing protein [unclassified Streptomyces]MYX02561.1 methyltransferase domain-containing protein [Streptomyces sp. SID8378]SNB68730.1 protein-L-isoaspartate(D-aspartate) O-methyltransferase [Streptomyces sp. PgraA7]